MKNKKKILAISGSTRSESTNLYLIKAIIHLTNGIFEINLFKDLTKIPHFNPDLDHEKSPQEVIAFRNELKQADGILICTPEYAMGVPGTLKNAIDWTVSSCEFSHKPTALITASSVGEKGHASLVETLKIIEAKITEETQLLISFAKTKINNENKIIDPITANQIKNLIHAFNQLIENS